jgi:hypothetical protein
MGVIEFAARLLGRARVKTRYSFLEKGGRSLPFQTSLVTVEALLAVSSRDGIVVLPEGVIVPPNR